MTSKKQQTHYSATPYSCVLSTKFDVTFMLLQLNVQKTKEADCVANSITPNLEDLGT